MKYLALKPWLKELEKCHDKVRDASLCDVIRSVTVDNHQVSITMRGEDSNISLDGSVIGSASGGIRRTWRTDFASLYNVHKEQFSILLEEIRAATDAVARAVGRMLDAFTSDQVPDLVLKRMKGEPIDSNPIGIIKMIAGDKLKELPPLLSGGAFDSYEIHFAVAGHTLDLQYRQGRRDISWGKLSISHGYRADCTVRRDNIEQALARIGTLLG